MFGNKKPKIDPKALDMQRSVRNLDVLDVRVWHPLRDEKYELRLHDGEVVKWCPDDVYHAWNKERRLIGIVESLVHELAKRAEVDTTALSATPRVSVEP